MYPLTEILLGVCSVFIVIAAILFIKTALKTRKIFSEVYKYMIGLFIITLFAMNMTYGYYWCLQEFITHELFITYRFLSDILLGVISFYLFIDIIMAESKVKYISKFVVILIATILAEGYLITFFQDPTKFNDIHFFNLLFNFYENDLFLFIIYGSAKLLILTGFFMFCCCFIYMILRNEFYPLKTKILLTIAVLSFIDIEITIPTFFSLEHIDMMYSLWILAFVFIILANLPDVKFESIKGVYEIIILYKDGRPLYMTGGEQLEPELVSGLLSAIIDISKEVFHSQNRLREIDLKDKRVIFTYGTHITTSIIVEKITPILRRKAEILCQEFEKQFKHILEDWSGNIEYFTTAWFLIDKIFPITEWQHKKSIEEFTKNLWTKINEAKKLARA
ncbi:MAG: hypothetical protein ACTSRP_19680 [Candidatus Helarchaeota archaeon]